MRLAELARLKVAILGYGREGRAAERLLKDRGSPPAAVFTGDVPVPAGGGAYREGLPGAAELERFDVVIRSPGISPYREPLASLASDGPTVMTGTGIWFAEHPEDTTVVVTGTKGKSTTAALIAHLARAAGRRVVLGGNIGVPLLELMAPSPRPDLWVIELSSYQIHGLQARPSIAVMLNLFPEHLDWHGSRENYFADKLSLLRGLDGIAVVNRDDRTLMERLPGGVRYRYFNDPRAIHVDGAFVLDGDRQLFPLDEFQLGGTHNRSNLCAALTVMGELDLNPAGCREAAASFQALPHRLQSVGVMDGIEFVDDSISTTPQSTMAAVSTYPDRTVSVLVGGYDRGLDWSGFAEFAAGGHALRVIAFGAAGERIAKEIGRRLPADRVMRAESLKAAVAEARKVTPRGGIVLLSPGAPSFDEFRDYADRGEAFQALARGS